MKIACRPNDGKYFGKSVRDKQIVKGKYLFFQYNKTSSLSVMTRSLNTSVDSATKCLAVTVLYRYIFDLIQVITSLSFSCSQKFFPSHCGHFSEPICC